MPAFIDRTGDRYGRLTVVAQAGRKGFNTLWRCRCDCGAIKDIRGDLLVRGDTRSCGCLVTERMQTRNPRTTHDMTHSPEYSTWTSMKQRCLNPNSPSFEDYGGRGITVCQRWIDSFENFLADMGPRPEGLSIDRIDNDGNYEPGNCRWADRATQNSNQRRSRSHP